MKVVFNDVFSGLLLVLFGVVVAFHAQTFPVAAGQPIGPGVFPLLLGIGIAAGGVVLAVTNWTRRRETKWIELEAGLRQPRSARNAALVVGALIVYALVVDVAGFFVTSIAILTTLFLAFGVSRRWILPIALGVTLALHVAFYTLLRVPLPWGWLEPMAW